MTIAEFMVFMGAASKEEIGQISNDSFKTVLEHYSIWDNATCKGYCTIAMKRAGIPAGKIKAVLEQLDAAFREVTHDEAQEVIYDGE